MKSEDYLPTHPEIKKNEAIALRIDDIGASSKFFEIYSKKGKGLGNFLFLKLLPGLRAWGPYREMKASEWQSIIQILRSENAKLTVAITASWVDFSGTLIPFPTKFPEEAAAIKSGVNAGVLEIAIHGLTHCQIENHSFRPKLFRGNRQFHREFLPHLPYEWHLKNLTQAKKILDEYFEFNIDLLIPPGNLFSDNTTRACNQLGIKLINCKTKESQSENVKIISNRNVFAFHDKEVVELGVKWLHNHILKIKTDGHHFCFVSDLAKKSNL